MTSLTELTIIQQIRTGSVSRCPVWRIDLERATGYRKVVDFGVAMLNFPWDEPGAENASIADHMNLIVSFSAKI